MKIKTKSCQDEPDTQNYIGNKIRLIRKSGY